MNHELRAMENMAEKHHWHLTAHENAYGVPLGVLKKQPTKKQLDRDFEDRRAAGELFTQQREKAESS